MFVAARKKGQPWSNTAWKAKDGQKATSHYQKAGVSRPPRSQPLNGPMRSSAKPVICYLCGMEGHTRPMCPRNSAKITQVCFVPRQSFQPKIEFDNGLKMTSIELNGRTIKALIDSGSTQTLVLWSYKHKKHNIAFHDAAS